MGTVTTIRSSQTVQHTATDHIQLSVVIPFYNPGNALRETVRGLKAVLDGAGVRYEILAVSDGSTDGSEATIRDLGPTVVVLEQPHNMGKGAALHRGFQFARGAWIGFVDADGDIDPAHVLRYYRVAQAGGYDAVYADKRHPGSGNPSAWYRRIVSVTFSTLTRAMFRIGVRDTQTGCKVFSRTALLHVLPRLREQRFAFDLEFFVAAHGARLRNLLAVPVQLEPRLAGSTVSTKAVLRTVRDMFTIYGRRVRGHYQQTAEMIPQVELVPAAA